mgnify:FL=1
MSGHSKWANIKNKKEKAEQILENTGKIVEDIQGLVEE